MLLVYYCTDVLACNYVIENTLILKFSSSQIILSTKVFPIILITPF